MHMLALSNVNYASSNTLYKERKVRNYVGIKYDGRKQTMDKIDKKEDKKKKKTQKNVHTN